MTRYTKILKTCIIFLVVLISGKTLYSSDNIFTRWTFDSPEKRGDYITSVKEEIRGSEYIIGGLTKIVPGVKGSAVQFDGFSSYIETGEESEFPEELPRELSVEAWISLGAYPWNWAPIITIGKYEITGFYFGIDSRGRLGFFMSDGTNVWHECRAKIDPKRKLGLKLREWYHVAATYSPANGIKLYINGELVDEYNDFTFDYGIVYSELEKGFRMGMNRTELAPTDPVRTWATYPSQYSLDGIIDELTIYSETLSSNKIKKKFRSTKPENPPALEDRDFPTVKNSGRFDANYTRLEYYREWDDLWPPGENMDVVVQFDNLPINVMFWRGSRYSPCWVTENGKWMADQSRETGNNWFLSQGSRKKMPTGCIEHMSDTKCKSSRVRIIENNDARIVVNWRYLQMDVKFRQKDLPNNTKFGEWGNELYYIYPDGVGVRHVLPGRGGWQETIFFNEPGTRPEDNIHLDAVTLLNNKGDSKTYSWSDGYPEFDLEDANIEYINLKSNYKPFLIFREGGGFYVFNLEVRPEYSHFPWWNHWPVAQVTSDGRYALAKDRAAHSSLCWGDPKGDAALYGMTNKEPESLVTLSRSWNYPAQLDIKSEGYKNIGYEYRQRAYIIERDQGEDLEFTLAGSKKTPIHNPAIVINNWGESDIKLKIDGKEIANNKNFRYGFEQKLNSRNLVIWLKLKNKEKTEIQVIPVNN